MIKNFNEAIVLNKEIWGKNYIESILSANCFTCLLVNIDSDNIESAMENSKSIIKFLRAFIVISSIDINANSSYINIFDNDRLLVSPEHSFYVGDYSMPNMSNSCRGENISIFVCFFRPLSPENILQLYFNASAKYGASFKFNSSASGSLSKNSEEGMKVICFLINCKTIFNSSCEKEVSGNISSVFLSSSYDRNSGAINSNLLDNLFASNILKQLPFLINAETITLTSTTSSIYHLSTFNNLAYLFANERLISSDSLSACSSVNLDLETIRFISANSSSSSFNLRDTANCQLILFINASSFNSSGSFIVISSIEKLDSSDYINLSNFGLMPILFWDTNDDIIAAFSNNAGILQGCFDMLFSKWDKERIDNFFYRDSRFEHFKDLPNHNSSAFEGWDTSADFCVNDNMLVNFYPHNLKAIYEVFKDFDLRRVKPVLFFEKRRQR